MEMVLVHIFIVAAASGAGFAAACWMLGSGSIRRNGHSSRSAAPAPASGDPEDAQRQLTELARRLNTMMQEMERVRAELSATRAEAMQYKHQAAQAFSERDEARSQTFRAQELLTSLQGLTNRMTQDVANHRAEVQEVSKQLSPTSSPQAVLEAVAKLQAANEQLQAKLKEAESRLQEKEQLLKAQMEEARTDGLTGLLNRRAFDAELSRLERAYHSQRRPTSLMMLDVDHFKKFNDTYGHQAGDAVLRGVAEVLSDNLSGNALVCRYGGEEFAVIFPGSDLNTILPAAERARAAIACRVFQFEGQELRVTASAGVASFTGNENSASLVNRADEALYACKKAGRNCGHYHDGQEIRPIDLTSDEPAVNGNTATEAARTATQETGTIEEYDQAKNSVSDRQAFIDDLQRRLSAWRRGGPDISVVLVEIDRFDRLTAAFGPAAGDLLIKATSQFLRAAVRDMDHVARYAKNQFAMLLPNTTVENAQMVAERLRLAIQKCRLPMAGGVLQFTVSAGVAQAVMNDNAVSLLARAERCLATAINNGGDKVQANLEPVALVASGE